MTRKKARIEVFKIIFEMECKKDSADEILSLYYKILYDKDNSEKTGDESELMEFPYDEQDEYINRVARGVADNLDYLDSEITSSLNKWQISRLPKVSLAVLRLALYEIRFCDDIPVSVSINEAVDIAKKYGDVEMAGFVNGILGRLSKK